jgi:hypothetical protein
MRLYAYVLILMGVALIRLYNGGLIGTPIKESLSLQAYSEKKRLRAWHRALTIPGHIKFKPTVRWLQSMQVIYRCAGKYELISLIRCG